jgi:hypothetical protein
MDCGFGDLGVAVDWRMTMGFYDHPDSDPTAENRRVSEAMKARQTAVEIEELADFLADPAVELWIEQSSADQVLGGGKLVAHRRIGG